MECICGNKVRLRRLKADDAEFLLSVERDPEVAANTAADAVPSLEDMQSIIAADCLGIAINREMTMVIESSESGEKVGTVQIFDYAYASAEVGIAILPSFRGKGFAREALELMMRYAATRLHISKLKSEIKEGNIRSERLFASVGFTMVGCDSEQSVRQYEARIK